MNSQAAREWNGRRVYAAVILVMTWINAARMLSAFDTNDKFGVVLLLKPIYKISYTINHKIILGLS